MPETLAEFADLLVSTLGRIDNTIILDGPPALELGYVGAVAIDLTNKLFYGPKTNDEEDPWGEGTPLAGSDGADGSEGANGADGADGSDGREVELQASGTHVQWRYVDAGSWTDIVALSALKGDTGDAGADGADGADGQEVELQVEDGYIQWRLGAGAWTDLILVADLKGDQGDQGDTGATGDNGLNPEFQKSATHLQWRLVGDTTWIDLIPLADLEGPPGADGSGAGDVIGPAGATDGHVAQFDGATGKLLKGGRSIGAASSTDVLDRAAGDGRYRQSSAGIPQSDVTDLTSALGALLPASYLDTDTALAANSDTKIATQKATKAYVDQIVAAQDAMVFKGVIDCSANPNYPAADRGWTYRTSVAGKIGGASGVTVAVGDIVMCLTDGTTAGDQATVGSSWTVIHANVDGALTTADLGVTVQAYAADLAAIAALTTATFGRSLLTLTSAADLKPVECLMFALSDETTAITTGTEKLVIRMPYAFTVTGVRASLTTASSSGNPTVDINENGSSILSTKLSIDVNEATSVSATTPAVISDASLADDAQLTFDIDAAGVGAVGLKVTLIGYRT